jgi:hypothetical protein
MRRHRAEQDAAPAGGGTYAPFALGRRRGSARGHYDLPPGAGRWRPPGSPPLRDAASRKGPHRRTVGRTGDGSQKRGPVPTRRCDGAPVGARILQKRMRHHDQTSRRSARRPPLVLEGQGEVGRTRRLPKNTGDSACLGANRVSPARAAMSNLSSSHSGPTFGRPEHRLQRGPSTPQSLDRTRRTGSRVSPRSSRGSPGMIAECERRATE